MMKKFINIITFPFKVTSRGFYNICLIISRGFYFYFYIFFSFLNKIFKLKFFEKIKNIFKRLQETPITILLLVMVFFTCIYFTRYGYADDVVISVDDSKEYEITSDYNESDLKDSDKKTFNLFKKYGSYKYSDIDFNELKKVNKNVVGWIVVDGTNINYPLLKTDNNDFYLYHDIKDDYSIGGWIFMDYRNTPLMEDSNTIIYGHNLLNRTAFGSLSNLYDDNWYNNSNHKIIVYTEDGKYTYDIFSVYYSDAETYYLTTIFESDEEYDTFLNELKNRSKYDFDVMLTTNDKVITLSTCTDDNSGRKVVHAKLV